MAEWYLWIKALHIIAVISWMAGLLYLPRLFVYHVAVVKGSEEDKRFQMMEYRLLRYIMNPAMIASLLLGIALIYISGAGAPGTGYWMHAKIGLLIGLFGVHGVCSKFRKDFAVGNNQKSGKFFRYFNEIPTILMVGIVVLAVVKPF